MHKNKPRVKKIRGKKVKPLIAYIYTENLQNGWKGNDGAMFIYRRIKIPKKEGFTKVKIITYTLNIKK